MRIGGNRAVPKEPVGVAAPRTDIRIARLPIPAGAAMHCDSLLSRMRFETGASDFYCKPAVPVKPPLLTLPVTWLLA